ncbi:hypothetical protein L1987_42572 [Smallanthus sonchifolius]|uniref:Uncharacterized protein n=1 Tax=Smallanthus sonchifolius TaxID=185202 RepID=A0ACB9GJ11_9ASTR|nr:hypothetical protein L1987_42572 [Smallanthus sonchifolius]
MVSQMEGGCPVDYNTNISFYLDKGSRAHVLLNWKDLYGHKIKLKGVLGLFIDLVLIKRTLAVARVNNCG